MPQNSQGIYGPPAPPTFPAEAGTTISAEYFNAVIVDLANAINTALLTSGQKAMAGNLVMNNNRVLGLPVATQRNEAISLETLIKRAVLTSAFNAQVIPGVSLAKFQIFTGASLTEYVAGQVLMVRFSNTLWSNATLGDVVKFQIDSLPEIDFRMNGDQPVTQRDIHLVGTLMVVIDFDGVAFIARLIYHSFQDVMKPSMSVQTSASSLGIGKYLLMNKPLNLSSTNFLFPQVYDVGEFLSNAMRVQVGTASGTYQVGALHGRGLYVLESSGISWTAGVKYGFFCEPGTGNINLANPINTTAPVAGMGFGSTLIFPSGGSFQASLYKVF